jgi:DMSO/TMAO reductase YedYZ molybdopterin-dependent catalytic subunit
MTQRFVSRGFVGKRREPAAGTANRIPPGQHEVKDFPVLSAGPTPRVNLGRWTFTIEGLVRQPVRWSWIEFSRLPAQTWMVDIHCVTKWTKLDARAQFVTAYSDGGYTTNMPLPDLLNGPACVAYAYDGR